MIVQINIGKCGVIMSFNLFKAFAYFDSSVKSRTLFENIFVFLQTCGTFYEQSSIISAMVQIGVFSK